MKPILYGMLFLCFLLALSGQVLAAGYGNGDVSVSGGRNYKTSASRGARYFGSGSRMSAFGVRDYKLDGLRFNDMRSYDNLNRLMSYSGYSKKQRMLGHRHKMIGEGYRMNGVRPVHR